VQVVDVSGKDGGNLSLAVEAAENNVRRQYTREEVEELAKRFKEAGYKTSAGKPKAGEKTVLNALEAAVGKSKRQIQNILKGKKAKKTTPWDKAKASLIKAANKVLKEAEGQDDPLSKDLIALANKALKLTGQK
jgi:hypothetical protein